MKAANPNPPIPAVLRAAYLLRHRLVARIKNQAPPTASIQQIGSGFSDGWCGVDVGETRLRLVGGRLGKFLCVITVVLVWSGGVLS